VSNANLRQLGLDSRDAGIALADLVTRGLAVKTGGRRYAAYVLSGAVRRPTVHQLELAGLDSTPPRTGTPAATGERRDRRAEILALFDGGAALALADVVERTGLGRAMTSRYLDQLVTDGALVTTAPPRSRHRRYVRPNPAGNV
jgi:ATP-dependent DNA helicase RecG